MSISEKIRQVEEHGRVAVLIAGEFTVFSVEQSNYNIGDTVEDESGSKFRVNLIGLNNRLCAVRDNSDIN